MNSRNVLKAGLLLGLAAIILIAFMPVVSGEQVEVYGRMKDESNAMIVGASITAYNVGTETEYETTSTDNGGSFEMMVPEGGYVFTFSKYEYSTEFAWFEVEGDDEDEMGLGVFYLTDLEPDTTFEGWINDSSTGEGEKNVEVWITYPDHDYSTERIETNKTGWFSLEFDSAEETWLVWDKMGFTFNTTEIMAPYNVTEFDITAIEEDDYHTVEGDIVDSSDMDDIEGARITLWNNDMSLWNDEDYEVMTGLTDDHGYRGFEVLEGTYTLLVEADGYEDYIDTNFNVPNDRAFGPGDTNPLALVPSEDGNASISIELRMLWNATVIVTEDINDDQDVWDHNWDFMLYDLWVDHGYGRVGPNSITGATLGDSDLTASEMVLVEDLYTYAGVPAMYKDLITIVANGTHIEYESELDSSEINTTDWWMSWTMSFTRMDGFEEVMLRFKTAVTHDTDLDYTYTYDLPPGWYPVTNDTVEDLMVTFSANGFEIDPDMSETMESVMTWVDVTNDDGDPMADFSITNFEEEGSDMTVDEGVHVKFNATASMDTGTYQSGIVEYKWDFGNGEMVNTSSEKIDYKYDIPGVYTVTLTVVDEADKMSAPDVYALEINDVSDPEVEIIPPWAPWEVNLTDAMGVNEDITANITDPEGVTMFYDITVTIKPAGSLEEDWTWMYYNDTMAYGGNLTFVFNYTFVDPGNYTIVVNATDDSDNWGKGSDGLTVVDFVAPIPNFIAQNKSLGMQDFDMLMENEEIIFNASIDTYMMDNTTYYLTIENDRILNCMWDFGDGTYDNETGDDSDGSEDNSIVSHVYHEPGDFTVTVTVKDNWKNEATVSMNVSVTDTTDPDAKFTIQVWNEEAEKWKDGTHVDEDDGRIMFNASTSTDTSDMIRFYNWSWGSEAKPNNFDNGTTTEFEASFNISGTYNITLLVWDYANHSSEITKTFTVVAGEKPDLIASLELSEKRVKKGDKVKAMIELKNVGDGDVGNTTDIIIELYEGDRKVKTYTHTGGLPADVDDVEYINLSWKPGRGTHDIKVVVDPEVNEDDEIEGAIDELKTQGGGEDNNEAKTSLVVEKQEEDDITMYLAITAVVILGIVVLLIRKKRQDKKLEEKLVGKSKKSKK